MRANYTVGRMAHDQTAQSGLPQPVCLKTEPRHEKTCLCHMQTTKARISLENFEGLASVST